MINTAKSLIHPSQVTAIGSRLPSIYLFPAKKLNMPQKGMLGSIRSKTYYCRPLKVINSSYREAAAEHFNITPYKEYWQPSPDSPPEQIFSEIYNSDAYIQEHEHIKAQPRMPGPQLEIVIGAIMLSSDSTHLTSFTGRMASLWPIYLYLRELLKFIRLKPTSFAAHHLVYIPKVIN